jgi:hypothetical protein
MDERQIARRGSANLLHRSTIGVSTVDEESMKL